MYCKDFCCPPPALRIAAHERRLSCSHWPLGSCATADFLKRRLSERKWLANYSSWIQIDIRIYVELGDTLMYMYIYMLIDFYIYIDIFIHIYMKLVCLQLPVLLCHFPGSHLYTHCPGIWSLQLRSPCVFARTVEDSVLQENSDDHEEDMITRFPPPQFASHLGIEKMMNNSSLKFFGSFFWGIVLSYPWP